MLERQKLTFRFSGVRTILLEEDLARVQRRATRRLPNRRVGDAAWSPFKL